MVSADGEAGPFVPALIVVDMQEDFCPPKGSLAVQDGRSIAPLINSLLAQPGFVTRIATQDYHPPNHISFASNHPSPNNRPFESFIEMRNPAPGKEDETKLQQLWPIHCVADTPGAAIIPEIDADRFDILVQKGKHSQVEMYSAFADAFGNLDPTVTKQSVSVDITSELQAKGVTDVFVVGLAGDYCVKCTAVDAVKAGFRSWLIEEGTKCVVPAGWAQIKEELRTAGVSVIQADDAVMKRLEGGQVA
ncbi:isochorismatase family hydrolase [Penicillium hispanicum]|uniref:isochorismatase family hydrolase n=1 Tax=Penicillium hispanicum TaxID=1080232 RepID=UPI00253FA32A|nr:isochorismatase family hydrolase [Penicillium hispanicum]KAJ5574265.1 isochorismatase family hydrolase [Penicillium hispanicum]